MFSLEDEEEDDQVTTTDLTPSPAAPSRHQSSAQEIRSGTLESIRQEWEQALRHEQSSPEHVRLLQQEIVFRCQAAGSIPPSERPFYYFAVGAPYPWRCDRMRE